MGKKLPSRAHFRSVLELYSTAVRNSDDQAGDLAKRAITRSLGIHTGEAKKEEIKKCKADILRAKRINPDLHLVHLAEGCYFYYCLRNYKKAIISFNNAFKKEPDNYKPLFYLTMVYKAMGNWDEVKSLLKRLKKFEIKNTLGLTNIGLCYEYLHDFNAAIKIYDEVINLDPHYEAAYLNKFRALLLKNDTTSDARNFFTTMSHETNDQLIEYQIVLDLYDGKYNDAFDKTLKAKDSYFDIKGERFIYLARISDLLIKKQDADKYYDTAIKKLNQALLSDPENPDLHSLKGIALAGKQNKASAVQSGKKAVNYARKSTNKALESDKILVLANIYSILGMNEEAIITIEELLRNASLFSTKILQLDPVWKPLLGDRRIKDIIKKNDKVLTEK